MLENISSTQKALGGIVVIVGVVGWIFAFVQIGEANSVKNDLEAAQSERSQLQQRVEGTKSLEELTAAIKAENAKLQSLRSETKGSQAELETLRAKVKRQQALLEGSMLQFKTKVRVKVRAGPGTDTDEIAVVPAGKSIQVFEIVEDGTWYKVGGMGYVFHKLLEPAKK